MKCVVIVHFFPMCHSLFSTHWKESGLFYQIKVGESSIYTAIIVLREREREERAGLWSQATLAV